MEIVASIMLCICFEGSGKTGKLQTCELKTFENMKTASVSIIKYMLCKLTQSLLLPYPR